MIETEKQKKEATGTGDIKPGNKMLDTPKNNDRPKLSFNPLASYKGVFKRFLLLYRHVLGLIIGGQVAQVTGMPAHKRKGLRSPFSRTYAFFLKIFIKKEFRKKPFEVQLRRRLEILGPTYIKLGQIMAIREDILPQIITDELKQLLDKLPEIPFEFIAPIIENSLKGPISDSFIHIEEHPVGTASIAQVHMATTVEGQKVVLKVIKPHIREIILSDIKLLKILGNLLALIIPQYQPKTIIEEFCRYTEKEVNLTYEADHSDMFNANFAKYEDVVFPKIYREFSSEDVLCMEFFDGVKPNDPAVFEKYSEKEIHKVVDLGTGSIIKMLYQDGFFHADLHAGNLIVLPGPKVGFIDVGMVGRFDDKIKHNMLYYFYYLVNGDIDNSAKYLFSMATMAKNGDGAGFKRAVIDLSNRFRLQAAYGNFSIAKLILESLSIGAKYHVFFPVEMTLMVKALVTFEGVGLFLDPHLDIPGLSKKHIQQIYKERYNPKLLGEHVLQAVPEMVDLVMRLPEIIHNTTRFWESTIDDTNNSNPMAGIRSGLIAGSCIVGGVIALVQGSDPYLWIMLFAFGIGLSIFGKS
ncbi:MAG: AarF/ABC1/UbiB kinase family protein [Calditrichaeota bacterium]|nr:MAG: AarF/ABC1/UbiB kinase family protein [Calditrichota bacterium]MBL1204901.1 AarF/ABC1/UbiB kinase family protein [Calditrichota bacterium]NOG44730.1 AarF/ABC1/UbiB kinase family protein [Calditrichota bacterium]